MGKVIHSGIIFLHRLLLILVDTRVRMITLLLLILVLDLSWFAVPALAQTTIGSQPLSIHDAIRLALARNSNIKAEINVLHATEAARQMAIGQLYPQINANIWYDFFPAQRALLLPRHMDIPTLSQISSATQQQTTQNMLNFFDIQFQDRVLNIGLGLNYAIYAGGRIEANIATARAEVQSQTFGIERVRQQLIFAVTQTYLGILVAERTERAVKASIHYLERTKANILEFVNAGKKPRLALLRVQTRLTGLQQELTAVQAELVAVKGNLHLLLDLDPSGSSLKLADQLHKEILSDIPDRPVPATFAQALNSRPDYQALVAQRSAQHSRLRAAEGAQLPEVNLSARAWEAHGNRIGGPVSIWEPDSQITFSASIPIFTGGILDAKVSHQQSLLKKLDNKIEGFKQKVRLQVIQSYADLRAAGTSARAARAGVQSSDEAFRVERLKAAVGAGTVTDLLSVQASDLVAQTSYFQALARYQIALAKKQLTTGALSISFAGVANAGH